MEFENSETLCQYMAERCNRRTVLSFSGGKDSLAAWLQLRDYFDEIVPFYMYLIPDLEFAEQGLTYYENFFDTRIIRLPHPSLYRMLGTWVFQPPQHCLLLESIGMAKFDYDDVYECVKKDYKLPDGIFTALGVRAADSPNRHTAMKRYGPVNETRQVFYPVYDWKKARLMQGIRESGAKLAPDYALFARSFDGIDYRFLAPIKEHYPNDYARILEFFPLAELELKRMEYRRDQL